MDYFTSIFSGGSQFVTHNVILSFIITIVCLVFVAAYYDSKNKQKFWLERGVRGPKPLPFVGNFVDLMTGNRLKKELKWVKEYGKVYGMFQGNTARLIVADPEILLQICIKDFETFPNHAGNEFGHKYFQSFLIVLRDQQWKRTRALQSPTFTSGKIKRMFRFLDGCADDLVQCFREQLPPRGGRGPLKAQVNVKDLYGLYTMDAITTCCYGLKLERAGSANLKTAATRDEFVHMAMKLFDFSIVRILIAFSFPKPLLHFLNFKTSPQGQIEPLARKVQQLIDQRRGSQKKFDDYLQLLIDAKLDDQLELNEMDMAENHHAALTRESLLNDQKQLISDIQSTGNGGGGGGVEATQSVMEATGRKVTLNDFEILSSAMFLIAVGLETTGTLLAHCTYALAFHPEIQERLYDEVMQISQFDESKGSYKFDYDSLTSCKYLDSVISEALRLLSPVIQLDRQSNRDYYLKKYNICLPKDSKINLAFYALMNDPDYWPEPERFNPDRFMPGEREKIVPGSYCPFGLGPRHCIGMRFSLTEAKLALAKMVANYRFLPAPNTKFPPEPKLVLALANIKTPFVIVTPRSN